MLWIVSKTKVFWHFYQTIWYLVWQCLDCIQTKVFWHFYQNICYLLWQCPLQHISAISLSVSPTFDLLWQPAGIGCCINFPHHNLLLCFILSSRGIKIYQKVSSCCGLPKGSYIMLIINFLATWNTCNQKWFILHTPVDRIQMVTKMQTTSCTDKTIWQ